MKLVYWKCRHLTDADCYSIRERTRKEAKAERERFSPEDFTEPYKVEVEYFSGFELMCWCTGEGFYEDTNDPTA